MSKIPLSESQINRPYKIISIDSPRPNAVYELGKYGFSVGEKVTLMATNYTKSAMLVKVMGINFVVDKEVCKGVIVSDE